MTSAEGRNRAVAAIGADVAGGFGSFCFWTTEVAFCRFFHDPFLFRGLHCSAIKEHRLIFFPVAASKGVIAKQSLR